MLERLKQFLDIPVKVFIGLVAFALAFYSYTEIEYVKDVMTANNFQAGTNVIDRMQTVEGIEYATQEDEAVAFFESNSGNKTFMQQACNDTNAVNLLYTVYGEDYVDMSCRAANY